MDRRRLMQKNPVNIRMIPIEMRSSLFKNKTIRHNERVTEIARNHLTQHKIPFESNSSSSTLDSILKLPQLVGRDIDEHFKNISDHMSGKYLKMADDFARNTFKITVPDTFVKKSGWYRDSSNNEPESVAYPLEETLVMDTETLVTQGHHPIMATAISNKAYYVWLSPSLFVDNYHSLINVDPGVTKLIIGHNVSFDRSKIKQEYSIKRSQLRFIDTLSLNSAIYGMSTQQRMSWMANRDPETRTKDQYWMARANMNDLAS